MNLLCLLASPRSKGNSSTLARRFANRAAQLGANVQVYELNKLSYKGCQGCMVCKNKLEHCVLQDDLAPVLDAMHNSEVLLVASPVYWLDVNAQLKTFIDRTYSHLKPDYLSNPQPSRLAPGKKLVFITSQGGEASLYTDIHPRHQEIFAWLGYRTGAGIRACSVRQLGEINTRADLLQEAEEAADRLFG